MAAIYFDMGSGANAGQNPTLVHHNIIWNLGAMSGFTRTWIAEEISDMYTHTYCSSCGHHPAKRAPEIYNNNFTAKLISGNGIKSLTDYETTYPDIMKNNIFSGEITFSGNTPPANFTNGIYQTVNPLYAGGSISSPETYFQLQAGSPARGVATFISGINDDDTNPKDAGAYPYGQPSWTAGYVLVPYAGTNPPPTVNAGPDKVIYLPTASVIFNGMATDTNGTITSYLWTKQSGPSATLTNTTTQTLTASGLVVGNYVFRLTAIDNGGASSYDDVALTVNAAGVNLALNKPTSRSSIEAAQYESNYAVDGNAGTRWSSTFSDAQWMYVDLQAFYNIQRVKISWDVAYGKDYKIQVASASTGPWTDLTSVTANSALSNELTGLSGVGRYVRMNGITRGTNWGYSIYELEVYGTAAPNQVPSASAGADKSVYTGNTTINGSGIDVDGTIASYAWTRISGPNTPSLTGANTANLAISGMVSGTYVYRLTVTDNGGLTATDDVTIMMNVNLALGKQTARSSVEAGQYESNYAVDGNAGTRWSSSFSNNQWLYVDLLAPYNIQRVKLTWDVAYATGFNIEVSNSTGGPWTSIYTTSTNSSMTSDLTGLSGAGRYIRFYGNTRATSWGFSFFEFEVYGTSFTGGRIAMEPAIPEQKDETSYSFSVYPNPVNQNDPVRLELSTIPGYLKVFDLIGRVFYEQEVTDYHLEIPTTKLGPGMYLFKYTTLTSTDLQKVQLK
jgi:hypothetical protein